VSYGADPIKAMDEHASNKSTADQILAQKVIQDYYTETGRTTPRPDFIVDDDLF
jgi:hypothetical protein